MFSTTLTGCLFERRPLRVLLQSALQFKLVHKLRFYSVPEECEFGIQL